LLVTSEQADLSTEYGPMRAEVVRPAGEGRWPGLVLFSEIFQITGPVRRLGVQLAGHGYVVAMPEIFHELEPGPGVVLAYDDEGKDRGNAHKSAKEVASYDADARAALDHLAGHAACNGRLGAAGICIGGHLALRAALQPDVLASACFYATDVHDRALGAGANADTIDRLGDVAGELLMVWGRQDPHVPLEGRLAIHAALEEAGTTYTWHEFNAQHAFLRDGGDRHDPALARICVALALELFGRRLAGG
jgi:carboxymethylenebutenolidase